MIDRLDLPGHQAILELLPFHANDSLTGSERERVQAHLLNCVACRRELARERELQQIYTAAAVHAPDSAQGLARLMATLKADDSRPPAAVLPFVRPEAAPVRPPALRPPYAAAAAVVLMVSLGAFLTLQVGRQPVPAPSYRTLASADALTPALPGALNLVLSPGLDRVDLERLLTGLQVTKIEVMAQPGTYQVQLQAGAASPTVLAAAAATLAQRPGVLFAAPVPRAETRP